MKKLVLIFLIIILYSNFLFSQSQKDPYAYLSSISKQEELISKRFLSFASASAHSKSARKVENRRKDLIKSVVDARTRISKMSCFESDCSLRDSIVSFLTLEYYVLNSDFEKILNMEEVAEESYDAMEAYLNAQTKANEKIHTGGEMIDVQYKSFAQQHHVNLSDRKDALSLQIDKVNKVNDHYQFVYLIFFKAYKQEAYLINALNKKDYSSAEQNRNALSQVSSECLGKLDNVKFFQNDRSLVTSCRHSLDFFKSEANDKIGIVIDFMIKNENFEKLQKTVGSKEPMLRTKDEVDQYNKSIKEYNVALKGYNSVNKSLEQRRASVVNEWNNTVRVFFEKYIPKYDK